MKQIFINLPVENLEKSMHFYEQIGFSVNPLFTDEDQKCMVWSDEIFVMLQSKKFFGSLIERPLSDSRKSLSATFTLPVENVEKVNEIVENGLKAGGKEPAPIANEGFMVLRGIEDLDGNVWGIIYLDVKKFQNFKEKLK